jgi:hypothetical protein
MDNTLKQVLLKLVTEIESVKATLLATTAHPSLKMSLADAEEATNQAKKTHAQHYENLRKEIEAL